MAMKPEIKDQWTHALRSNEFPQGKNRLRKVEGGYCCLGVLCELAVRAGVIPPAKPIGTAYEYDGDTAFLPESVRQWAGIVDEIDADEGTISDLIGYNDDGKPFTYIADEIERRL